MEPHVTPEPAGSGPPPETSSTGLDPNLAALLAYLLGFVSGIALLLIEKRSSYVRFHAMQSTITFISLLVISAVANVLPLIGTLVSALIVPVSVILWAFLMWQAFAGERYKLPIVGDVAEERTRG